MIPRKIRKDKYFKVGHDKVKQIQDYFLNTGDTCVNIAAKFEVSITTTQLITQEALKQYQHAKAKSKAHSNLGNNQYLQTENNLPGV